MAKFSSLDRFFSENSTRSWLKIIGSKRHYHVGHINPEDPDEDLMDYEIRYLYRWILDESSILDCGCGWAGPASMFVREKKCKVTGVTISKKQYQFIKNHVKEVEVICEDLHAYKPRKKYDLAFFGQSYTHLENPKKVLANLYPKVDRILISDFVAHKKGLLFPSWCMYIRTKEEFLDELASSGYKLKYYGETSTKKEVEESALFWLRELSKLNPLEIYGQLEELKNLSLAWLYSPHLNEWSKVVLYAEK